jgi:hypothetical protein
MRVWDGRNAQCLAVLRAHQGGGTWCCAAGPRALVATGGGDCSLKLWALSEWLPPAAAALLSVPQDVRSIAAGDHTPCARSSTPPLPTQAPTQPLQEAMLTVPSAEGGDCSAASVHAGAREGVAGLALSETDCLYVATTGGRLMRAELIMPSGAAGAQARWEIIAAPPQQLGQLSCCAARRRILGAQSGSCDVVVCGARGPGLMVACMRARAAAAAAVAAPGKAPLHTRGAVACSTLQGNVPMISVWLPAALPATHMLCGLADSSLRWLVLPHMPSEACVGEPVEVARGYCGRERVAAVEAVASSAVLVVGGSLGSVWVLSCPPALMRAADTSAAMHACATWHGSSGGGGAAAAAAVPAVLTLCSSPAFRHIHGATPVTLAKAVAGAVWTGGRDGACTLLLYLRSHASAVACTHTCIYCCTSAHMHLLLRDRSLLLPRPAHR